MWDVNVSPLPALKVTPAEVVVPTNCFLIVYWVSDSPWFNVVNNVLMTGLDNLYNNAFFSGDFIIADWVSRPSWIILPEPVSSSNSIDELRSSSRLICEKIFDAWSRTTSAVKSSPDVVSSINTCLVSENWKISTIEIVKSTFPLSSTISSVSAESEAVIFSPAANSPTTFVKSTVAALVPSPKTKPVAPDDTPLIWTPPSPWVAIRVGLGVPLIVSLVKGLTSNKYNLYTASVFDADAPAVPELYSMPLALATPIWFPAAEPLVAVIVSYKSICLNAVVSPLIGEISGLPYKLVMLIKFPNSATVTPALTFSKSLALAKVWKCELNRSNSWPLTYALWGEISNCNWSVAATKLSSVVSPAINNPTFSLIVTLSCTLNSNGLTV